MYFSRGNTAHWKWYFHPCVLLRTLGQFFQPISLFVSDISYIHPFFSISSPWSGFLKTNLAHIVDEVRPVFARHESSRISKVRIWFLHSNDFHWFHWCYFGAFLVHGLKQLEMASKCCEPVTRYCEMVVGWCKMWARGHELG